MDKCKRALEQELKYVESLKTAVQLGIAELLKCPIEIV